ncbi:ABC transporter family protein [Rhodococcus sp. MTM3W5.2]|uniref:ATP-binding cassette domain-containing protein n=1 Tax=Rhodococcus sp. MTM3W5.2 TaxID=1805827 RepID=UPI00097973AA|nr:ATP-binding cassette domain-containing protein [Rhodococcus sp. MTM3W5.2]AQA23984.1 ABC transporter family protein [Rhodococcus sp. MTM3W5.2]
MVGESGSGKSTLIRLLCALDTPTAGSIVVDGQQVAGARERELRQFRRDVSIVFQDPMGSLDPRMKVGDVVSEPLDTRTGSAEAVAQILIAVGLEPEMAHRYPHQFSGGQRQRISIARALITKPKILVADEPVSALDVSVRAQVLDLLAELVDEYRLTLLFVSHDLAVVRHVCDVVAVMHRGRIVECGPTEDVYERPREEYTRTLIASAPKLVLPDL